MSEAPPLDAILRMARRRPSTLFLDGSFAQYVAFFAGMEMGARVQGDDMFSGFSTWLAGRIRHGFNLAWPTLVLMTVFPDREVHALHMSMNESEDKAAVEGMFRLLSEFLDVPQDMTP